jgi:hypothetical protein
MSGEAWGVVGLLATAVALGLVIGGAVLWALS